jgi:hypothetical protein
MSIPAMALYSLAQAVGLVIICLYLVPMVLFMWARSIAAGWHSGSITKTPPAMFPFNKKKDD